MILIGMVSACGESGGESGGDDGGTNTNDSVTFNYTGAAESYTVPEGVVMLRIQALGASGGDTETDGAAAVMRGGYGASVDATVSVTAGDMLTIVVGQQPALQVAGSDGCGGSGGGGTYVVRDPATPLVVAGGGGGSSGYDEVNGQDASTTENGVDTDGASGGTGGGGGGSPYAGGGGGFSGDGTDNLPIEGGKAFTNGSAGGARDTDESCGTVAKGGFGGGGGGEYDDAAGGGGYSGGAGASDTGGGGGGSYDASGSGTITIRTLHGHGEVTLTPEF